jgi:hypothetical protein
VHKIQAGYKITPLSRWGKAPEPVTGKVDPTVDMKTPPKIQVDTMPADKYFTYAVELLKLHPPHISDQPIVARMKRIGIEPGKSFDFAKLDPNVQKALASAPEDAQKLMKWKVPTLARVVNYWSMNTDTMGVYGNYYLKRAMVAQMGLGANLPEDAIYLYFRNESPGANKEANWLPAPKGPFNLCMRLYAPKSDALTGKWNPPPVTKIEGASELMPQ